MLHSCLSSLLTIWNLSYKKEHHPVGWCSFCGSPQIGKHFLYFSRLPAISTIRNCEKILPNPLLENNRPILLSSFISTQRSTLNSFFIKMFYKNIQRNAVRRYILPPIRNRFLIILDNFSCCLRRA